MDAEISGSDQPKARGRPFRPGQSGNPQGKPRGVRNRATLLLDKMAETDAAEVYGMMIIRAKKGEMAAAGMIMARVWPPRKVRSVIFGRPPHTNASELAASLGPIAQAVGT